MKFGVFKEFRKDSSDIDEIVKYLKNELAGALRELSTGIKKLSFSQNFQSFSFSVENLSPQAEITIQNQIIDNKVRVLPSVFIITNQRSGKDSSGAFLPNNVPVSIVIGDTQWTTDFLYLKNVGTQAATFTVIFLR